MPQNALAVALGALLAYYGNALPDLFWSALAPLALGFAWLRPRQRFVLLIGAAYLWSAAVLQQHLDRRLAPSQDNRITLIQGTIAGLPDIDPGRIRFHLRLAPGGGKAQPRLVRLNWYQDRIVPRAGETWRFEIKWRQPRGLLNPAGFDYGAWLFNCGIDATGYVRESAHNMRLAPAAAASLDYQRTRLAAMIDRLCSDCSHSGLFEALVLGFRGDIEATHDRLLRNTGTAHLLAISGLHIGLVAGFFFALGRGLWRLGLYRSGMGRIPIAAASALAGGFAYAALAGFSLPTQRALIMLACFLLAMLVKTRLNLLQAISLALIAIVLFDPRAVGSASLWLSVAALLVICVMRFRFPDDLPWWRRLLLLQLCFALLFTPLSAVLFGQLTPASLGANLVAIPLVSLLLLPLILFASGLGAAGFESAGFLFHAADRLLGWLMWYLQWLLGAGLDAVPVALPLAWWCAFLLALLLLVMPIPRDWRKPAVLLLTALALWRPGRLPHGDYSLTVLDVGMGTSILLRTREHSLVYDFGPGRAGQFSAAEWGLLPLLRGHGIDTPDLLVISHSDQDHSGGFLSFLGGYAPSALVSGTPGEVASRFALDHRVRSCHDFPRWSWDGVDFRFLVAGRAVDAASTNNRSCILLVDGRHKALIPGDIEAVAENELAHEYAALMPVDVLLAPHHGSMTSSSSRFLHRARPRIAIFTVSRGNRWGFPRPTVLQRYRSLGTEIYRSDRDGAVIVRSAAQGLEIDTAAEPKRRIWRRW